MDISRPFLKTISRKSLAVFLLGVFCIFSTCGIASDILDMGREPVLHYVLGVLLAGTFSMVYALCGFILRKDFWKAFLPIFAVHFMLMNVLARVLPTAPRLVQMGGSEIARLHNRLMFDALAVVAAMAFGLCLLPVCVHHRGAALLPRACGNGTGGRDSSRHRSGD